MGRRDLHRKEKKTITENIIAELDRMELTKVTNTFRFYQKEKKMIDLYKIFKFFEKKTCLFVFKGRMRPDDTSYNNLKELYFA